MDFSIFENQKIAFSGLGRLTQAEEYLSQAQWTVLKTPECTNAIKSRLFRNLGLLYAAKGEDQEALRALADDVSGARNGRGIIVWGSGARNGRGTLLRGSGAPRW